MNFCFKGQELVTEPLSLRYMNDIVILFSVLPTGFPEPLKWPKT